MKKINLVGKQYNIVDILTNTIGLPGVKIDREKFLRNELHPYYSDETINIAIEHNPAYAKIQKEAIDKIASKCIKYETNKVSAVSFAAGLPGGIAMAATIPADITQYFVFILRIAQKLVYLYGFEALKIDEDHMDDGTMNQLLIFIGVMFGVHGANKALKTLAAMVAKNIEDVLMKKALTKGVIFPIAKNVAKMVGVEMTKQFFAKGVTKIVPVIGGVATGALTYATFRPQANSLKKQLRTLPIADPKNYE